MKIKRGMWDGSVPHTHPTIKFPYQPPPHATNGKDGSLSSHAVYEPLEIVTYGHIGTD